MVAEAQKEGGANVKNKFSKFSDDDLKELLLSERLPESQAWEIYDELISRGADDSVPDGIRDRFPDPVVFTHDLNDLSSEQLEQLIVDDYSGRIVNQDVLMEALSILVEREEPDPQIRLLQTEEAWQRFLDRLENENAAD